jgi:Protein of unknown function (DUF1194)
MLRTIVSVLAFVIAIPAARPEPVDLALVLAVDVSGSVDREEYDLQMRGVAWAFRQSDVLAAIKAGRLGRISVNLMSWGEPDYEKPSTGWRMISNAVDAESFAATAEVFEGRVGGGTGLGAAIGYGITLIETSGLAPLAKVIDVSGDGTESGEIREPRFKLANAQALRAKHGITINGLAIKTDTPDLDRYYRTYVAGGPGSFVMSATHYQDYAEAFHRKLLRELQPNLASAQ